MSRVVPPHPDSASPFGQSGSHRAPPWFLDFGGVLRRHPIVMTLALIACGLAGFAIGTKYKTNLWTIEGRLRFVKPPVAESGRPNYESMSLASYADLIVSEEALKPVAAEFADRLPRDNPIRFLQKELKVDTPRMADIVEVKFDAADPEFGVALVNRVLERQIEYTNILRRASILRAAGESLRHKIAECESSVRRMQRTIDDYRGRLTPDVALEKLENVELDSATMQRRKSLLDEIEKVRASIKELTPTLRAKQAELAEAENLWKKSAIASVEVTKLERDVAVIQSQIRVKEESIRSLEQKFRDVPIEYYSARIIDLQGQRAAAEHDLKLLNEKLNAARAKGIPPGDLDSNDEDWSKLRTRLMGPDIPEFEVIKPGTAPLYPNVSNRKILTLGAFGVPFSAVFLLVALFDFLRPPRPGRPAEPAKAADSGVHRLPAAEGNPVANGQNGHSGSGRYPKLLPPPTR
jgi:hypothetical protein